MSYSQQQRQLIGVIYQRTTDGLQFRSQGRRELKEEKTKEEGEYFIFLSALKISFKIISTITIL